MHLKIGDLVWAKLGRYPPWPGLITEPPSTLEKSKPKTTANKLCVYFFGSKNFSWVPLNNIKPYSKSKNDSVNEKRHVSKYKAKALQKAVMEIEKYIQENNSSSSGKQSGSIIATFSASNTDDPNANKAITCATVETHNDQPHHSDTITKYSNATLGNCSGTAATCKSNNPSCSYMFPDEVANEDEISSQKLGLNSSLCPPSKNIVTSLLASVVDHPNENNITQSDSIREAVLDFMGRMESNKHVGKQIIASENEDQMECSNINPSNTNNIFRLRKRVHPDSIRNGGICLKELDPDITVEEFNKIYRSRNNRIETCCSKFDSTCLTLEELYERGSLTIPPNQPAYEMLKADILDVMSCIMKNRQQKSLTTYDEVLSINDCFSAAITNKEFQLTESNRSSNINQSTRTPEEHCLRTEGGASQIADNLKGGSNTSAAASFAETENMLKTNSSIKDLVGTASVNETGIPESLNYLLRSVVTENKKFTPSFIVKD